MRKELFAGALVSCCACQVYTPIDAAPHAVGADVRVTLTDAGMRALSQPLGVGAAQVQGRLSDATDSTLTMDVTELTRLNGVDENWNGERLTIARGDIATVERRQLSVVRSVLLAGAVAGSAFLVAKSAGGASQSGRVGGGPPAGQQ